MAANKHMIITIIELYHDYEKHSLIGYSKSGWHDPWTKNTMTSSLLRN